ncbi:hypothetical protein [Paenibacillus oleatilyticus]|uniref:hypothetical protein n=1 Tax=Paenibacillus oleatilyticus TaxID=2594886 RepID=UPI001C1FB7BE|nr:hypothetical protein [Paenibacillus oleatilyticus]MBU7320764.1 hypothetical protein [Paenibacillus oleatilyticus]
MKSKPYNPYEDVALHATQPSRTLIMEDRKAFNDAIHHFDVVQGVSTLKRLDHYPSRIKNPFRLYVIISVGSMAVALAYSFIQNVWAALNGG